MYSDTDIHREARQRVHKKARFYKHLTAYLIVNGFLFMMTLFSGNPGKSLPVAFFWGIGLAAHYLKVFGMPGSGVLSREWEEREVRREVERLNGGFRPADREEKLELKELRKNYNESDLV